MDRLFFYWWVLWLTMVMHLFCWVYRNILSFLVAAVLGIELRALSILSSHSAKKATSPALLLSFKLRFYSRDESFVSHMICKNFLPSHGLSFHMSGHRVNISHFEEVDSIAFFLLWLCLRTPHWFLHTVWMYSQCCFTQPTLCSLLMHLRWNAAIPAWPVWECVYLTLSYPPFPRVPLPTEWEKKIPTYVSNRELVYRFTKEL